LINDTWRFQAICKYQKAEKAKGDLPVVFARAGVSSAEKFAYRQHQVNGLASAGKIQRFPSIGAMDG
jgi:hypothetical protein